MVLTMFINDLLNAALALATFLLAIFTWRMVKRTADSIAQQERHHRDRMRPYCIMTFENSDQHNMFGSQFYKSNQGEMIRILGKIDNKGGGPAKEVNLYLNTRRGTNETDVYRLTRMKNVSGLIASGETIQVNISITEDDIINAWNGSAYHKTANLQQAANDCYEVVLEYKSVLQEPDNTFRTVHSKGIYQIGIEPPTSEMAANPLVPMPKFLTGTQSMHTLNDVPRSIGD